VAEEAGVQQGHLTYYFPRRADLVVGVLQRFVERLRQEGLRLRGAATPREARQQIFDLIKVTLKNRDRTRLMLGLLMEVQGDAALSAPIAEVFATQRRSLALLTGRDEEDLDIELALAALRGLGLEQMVVRGPRRTRADDERLDALVDRLAAWLDARPGSSPA
jgi:AcrR family transcriptional regulator